MINRIFKSLKDEMEGTDNLLFSIVIFEDRKSQAVADWQLIETRKRNFPPKMAD